MQESEALWRALYAQRWPLTPVTHAAVKLAGGWKRLYGSKQVTARDVRLMEYLTCAERKQTVSNEEDKKETSAVCSRAVRTPLTTTALQATDQANLPNEKPCTYEKQAAITQLVPGDSPQAGGLTLLFLVDGSGSVGADDFQEMKSFMTEAAAETAAKVGEVRPLWASSNLKACWPVCETWTSGHKPASTSRLLLVGIC